MSSKVLKGFLYQNAEGTWVLSPEPNLKSCCILSEVKRQSQVIIEADFPKEKINTLVQISGDLESRSFHTHSGKSITVNYLTNAKLVENNTKIPVFSLGLLAFALGFSGIYIWKKISKKKS